MISLGLFLAVLALALTLPCRIGTATTATASSRPSSPHLIHSGSRWDCKCYVGDPCWPDDAQWEHLNASVGGGLAVQVPPEAACHEHFDGALGRMATYDEAKCAEVIAKYANEEWSTEQSALLLWKYFTNATCQPTEDPSQPCTSGYYGVYVVEATQRAHVKAVVDFVREHRIRLIIRNTGHDFIGRSTGWGALVLNMRAFRELEFVDAWNGPGEYSGGAVTIGAGVKARDLLRQGSEREIAVTVVTGECPTVGVAGGLVQGGGHGPLTTLYGFTADNAISFDVLTAQGDFLTANAASHPDLFWALRGGGPSSFAVVLSATFKTIPEQPSAGATLYLNSTHIGTDADRFWEGVRIVHAHANSYVDSGLYAYYEVFPLTLRVRPWVAFGKTAAELDTILAPLRAELTAQGIPFEYDVKDYPIFHSLYIDLFEDEMAGGHALTGGWIFGRQDVEENVDGIVEAMKTVISPREDLANEGIIIGHMWNAGFGVKTSDIATHPRTRDASVFVTAVLPVRVGASLEEKAERQQLLTHVVDEKLRQAGKHGCAYVNEADPYQPNWQTNFWGANYPKLRALRQKWDPEGVFYAVSTPGTEEWEVIEHGTRLCKNLGPADGDWAGPEINIAHDEL